MANKLVEGGVARVEQIGGFIEKTVGKVLGSERLKERGQGHLDHAAAVRHGEVSAEPVEEEGVQAADGEAEEVQAQPAATGKAKAKARKAEAAERPQKEQVVAATPQTGQSGGGHPPSLQKKTPRRQYAL